MRRLLLLFLLTLTLFAKDIRLKDYPQAQTWEKIADTQSFAAYNLGRTYQTSIKDSNKTIFWYKKAYQLDNNNTDAANNLAYLYEDLEEYTSAIFWFKTASTNGDTDPLINLALLYKKAYKMGNISGAHGLGYLYFHTKKEEKNAELWYKKATKQGYAKSYKSLAFLNRDRGDKVTGAAWYIALINIKYSKEKVVNYLNTKWKLTQDELNKAYKLQQRLDIPKHYTGGIN